MCLWRDQTSRVRICRHWNSPVVSLAASSLRRVRLANSGQDSRCCKPAGDWARGSTLRSSLTRGSRDLGRIYRRKTSPKAGQDGCARSILDSGWKWTVESPRPPAGCHSRRPAVGRGSMHAHSWSGGRGTVLQQTGKVSRHLGDVRREKNPERRRLACNVWSPKSTSGVEIPARGLTATNLHETKRCSHR